MPAGLFMVLSMSSALIAFSYKEWIYPPRTCSSSTAAGIVCWVTAWFVWWFERKKTSFPRARHDRPWQRDMVGMKYLVSAGLRRNDTVHYDWTTSKLPLQHVLIPKPSKGNLIWSRLVGPSLTWSHHRSCSSLFEEKSVDSFTKNLESSPSPLVW